MITTRWDQDAPYNDSCPSHTQYGRALTGCVATAMAQVMKYWNYPERGTGTHTYNSVSLNGLGHTYGEQTANFGATVYDWDNMPNSLTTASPDVQKAAVATLMYHCDVACDLYYGSSSQGSGASIHNIPFLRGGNTLNGMIKYFGYSSSATGMDRIKYDDNTWAALVRGELDASRPIIYVGFNQNQGHCFVCDGYDDENRYHFNWGWSGDGDGFFTLNSLTPNDGSYTYNFTSQQQMLVGVQPHTGDDTLCIIRQFPYTEDFETAPTGWEATASNIRHSHSWRVADSTGVDGNYSAGVFKIFFDESDNHMFSPSIVTPGDYKVNWQVRAKDSSGSDSYTLTIGTETFDDTVESTTWQPHEFLFSVAEGDTVRLDFGHITRTNSVGLFIDHVVIEQMLGDYTITVSANPSNGGTVEGGGTYQQGQSCTVTATANDGYTFINWTEDSEVVSEEMTYTFVATQSRDLVAHFVYTEGIGEQSVHSLVIYPNPVNDKLTVEAQGAIGTVEIYDLMGAMVYSQKNCGNKMEINIADLQNGIYFIHLMNDKVSVTKKFVKE